ncbi:hypothetical protein EJ02DRAFT_514394 [Clathrospora elynae]|uniref:Uncharacterized protein n=1 Tax=Clathrospora elynae TaxID=706981 RepID=A0A6A5SFY7_9PLEO|nr:hypothetical protein EJ02DRAFT_514394 [Clathrospora elynae]
MPEQGTLSLISSYTIASYQTVIDNLTQMAPLPLPHPFIYNPSPLPTTITTTTITTPYSILTSFQKRSTDCESYYTTSCNTHRTVILFVIVFVGVTVGIILSLVYAQSHRKKKTTATGGKVPRNGFATNLLPSGRVLREGRGQRKLDRCDGLNGRMFEAPPPPYMPRTPEAARMSR